MGISQPTIKIKASLDEQSLATVKNRVIGECKNIERQSKIKIKIIIEYMIRLYMNLQWGNLFQRR